MDALSNIGNWISSGAGKGILTAGTLAGGGIQNLLAARQANQKTAFVKDLITNPAKFNALVAKTEQPLSQGLTSSIARQTDAYGAERGLGSSPAVMADVYAQALAPYQQQEQQAAINSVLSRLGTYASTPTMQPVNVGPMLQALMMKNPSAAGTPTTTPSPVPSPSVDAGSGISWTPTVPGSGDSGDTSIWGIG